MNLYIYIIQVNQLSRFCGLSFKRITGCYLEIDLTDSRIMNSEIRETSWETLAIIHARKMVVVAFISVMVEVIREEFNSQSRGNRTC